MATTPVSDSEKKVVDDADSDDAVLAQLGYTQGAMKNLLGALTVC